MLSGFQLYFQRRRDQLCEVWEVFPPSQIDREQRRQREVETVAGCVTPSALYFYNNSSYHNYVHKDERYVARTLHTVITRRIITLSSSSSLLSSCHVFPPSEFGRGETPEFGAHGRHPRLSTSPGCSGLQGSKMSGKVPSIPGLQTTQKSSVPAGVRIMPKPKHNQCLMKVP